MALTLYYAPNSSASPVKFVLAELGLEHETVTFDLEGDAHKQPDYLALNPMGQVPTLVDGDQAMFESAACVIYLGEKYGVERGLWPELGSAAHMRALTWTVWSAVSLGGTIAQWFAEVDGASDRFAIMLGVLDKHLEGQDYLLGGEFSVADYYPAAIAFWSAGVLSFDTAATPNLAAWAGRCMGRPAIAALI